MMLFQRHYFYELLRNLLSTVVLLSLVVMLVMSAMIINRVEGLTLGLFARSLPIFAANELWITLPLSVLVSVILTYGRAAADREIDGLRACGIRPVHLYTPALVFGALVSLAQSYAADHWMPLVERSQQRILKQEDVQEIFRGKLRGGEPVRLADGKILSVEGFDEQGHPVGMRIQGYDEDTGDLTLEVYARSGRVRIDEARRRIELVLLDSTTVVGMFPEGKEVSFSRPLPGEDVEMRKRDWTTTQLLAWLQREPPVREPYHAYLLEGEIHARLSASAAPLLFVLLGLPVALLFRKSDRVEAFLIAFLLTLFVYYPTHKLSEAMLEEARLGPIAAAWIGSAVLLLVALGLTWRAFRR